MYETKKMNQKALWDGLITQWIKMIENRNVIYYAALKISSFFFK